MIDILLYFRYVYDQYDNIFLHTTATHNISQTSESAGIPFHVPHFSLSQAILHYKSFLLQTFSTIFYALPLILGFTEERQSQSIVMIERYNEPYVSPKQIIPEYCSACIHVDGRFQLRSGDDTKSQGAGVQCNVGV